MNPTNITWRGIFFKQMTIIKQTNVSVNDAPNTRADKNESLVN